MKILAFFFALDGWVIALLAAICLLRTNNMLIYFMFHENKTRQKIT